MWWLLGCSAPSSPDPDRTGEVRAALSPALPVASFEGARPRNLLVLSLDTLRPDQLGHRGGPVATPTLDGLAESGLALGAHRSCSNWTLPSMTCVLSGQTGLDQGFVATDMGTASVPETLPLLAPVLEEAGFDTAVASASGFLGNEAFGLTRGYGAVVFDGQATLEELYETARGLVGGDRWYLHLHAVEPHAPYVPPPEHQGFLEVLPPIDIPLESWPQTVDAVQVLRPLLTEEEQDLLMAHIWARYRGEVEWLDAQLGRVLERADDDGLLEDTLVVVVSDHGEQFLEHGQFTHGFDLYGEESDALAILWAPGIVAQRWAEPTNHTDLGRVVLDALGLDPRALGAGEPTAFAGGPGHSGPRIAWTTSTHRLHLSADGEAALFHLAVDPREQHPIDDEELEGALSAQAAPMASRFFALAQD